MKKWLFSLMVTVILVGCAPGDIIVTERPLNPDPLRPVTPTPIPSQTVTNVPLRETVTPNPAGQILDGTSWRLTHYLIEGEVRELKNYETLNISFGPERVGTYDGCNSGGYENAGGSPAYAATEKGEFVFPLGERTSDGSYSISFMSQLLACYAIDEETGEEHPIGIQNFRPLFEQLVAYELSDDRLLLYYPEDKRNALVFQARIVEPTGTPEPTETSGPTWTPGPTPIPPTPLPTCTPPLTPQPSPTVSEYPAPSTPCPATPYP